MTAELPSPSSPSPAPSDVEALSEVVFGRRRILQAGGLAAVAAAVLAACGGDSPEATGQVPQVGVDSSPTTVPAATLSNVTLLRTAASVARAVVETYDGLLSSGKLTTAEVVQAAQLFRDHHIEHAEALDVTTEREDGEPYTDPNPLVMRRVVTPGLKSLTDEVSAVALAYLMESISADTYQLFVPLATSGSLRQQFMNQGGVIGRQTAVLAMNLPYGEVVEVPDNTALPEGATTTTTTTIAGAVVPDTVYAVPGSFGSTAAGVGPSYYV